MMDLLFFHCNEYSKFANHTVVLSNEDVDSSSKLLRDTSITRNEAAPDKTSEATLTTKRLTTHTEKKFCK